MPRQVLQKNALELPITYKQIYPVFCTDKAKRSNQSGTARFLRELHNINPVRRTAPVLSTELFREQAET